MEITDPAPLTSDPARRADVAGITDALDPTLCTASLHGADVVEITDPAPLTSDPARRADVAGITDALDPNTLHGEQTPASACSDAVRSDLAAAGAKMAAFRRRR